tara:strand:+ start:1617 stop:2291 length:675 start_codon:yes stop_codon:yes gene_type:complete
MKQETILFDLWGVVLCQLEAGKVMVDAYTIQAQLDNIPQQTIEQRIREYELVLQNDKSVADRKTEIVNTVQDLAEKYIETADDPNIKQNLEDAIYQDFKDVHERAVEDGYNVAIFTTRQAEWMREYIDDLGTIYDAQDGKSAKRINEIVEIEASEGKTVVSFTEDAAKALLAAKESGEIQNLIYLNRGDNGMTPEECEELGIIYTEDLNEVYDELTGEENEEQE